MDTSNNNNQNSKDMIRFDNRVVIITGAGGGLGRTYALEFAKRGAKVVVNDFGGSRDGSSTGSASPADVVVDEIKALGGDAIANYDNVATVDGGEHIVQTAKKAFGRVDILINNAGILSDKSFVKMLPENWQSVVDVHLNGAYNVTRPAFKLMKEQGYGRIIMTTSAAGLYGNFGQTNYSSAKAGLVGLMNTLKIEGLKYNIKINTVAPLAASRLTEDVFPPDFFEKTKPDFVAPIVLYLCSESCPMTGGIYNAAAGYFNRVAMKTGPGVVIKGTSEFPTVEDLIANKSAIDNMSQAKEFFQLNEQVGDAFMAFENPDKIIKQSETPKSVQFDNQVAIITGAGGGLGRVYALDLARRGAKVLVNDLGGARDGTGNSTSQADRVVDEIKKLGGTAIANYDNVATVEGGKNIVKSAIETFGRLDIVINNAGILRDKSFVKMTSENWKAVINVHLDGAFHVTQPAFAIMKEQGYGRIIMTTSAAGLYGNFGQANYSAAKMALVGLMNTLKIEGARYNIKVNTVAPLAASRLTEDITPKELFDKMKPEFVSPIVLYLLSEKCAESGAIFNAGMGYFNRAAFYTGPSIALNKGMEAPKPEDIQTNWEAINLMDDAKEMADANEATVALLSKNT